MSKKNIHITPHGDKWAVTRENAERASSVHDTQKEAINDGREMAKKDGVEFTIHGRDGKIRDKDSYGKDPCPPKDKKH